MQADTLPQRWEEFQGTVRKLTLVPSLMPWHSLLGGLQVDSVKPPLDPGTGPISRAQRYSESSPLRNGLSQLLNKLRVTLRITSQCLNDLSCVSVS